MKKNICYIVYSSSITGALKRFLNTYDYLSKNSTKHNYFLITTHSLKNLANSKNLKLPDKNIFFMGFENDNYNEYNKKNIFSRIKYSHHFTRFIYYCYIKDFVKKNKIDIIYLGPGGIILSRIIKHLNKKLIMGAFNLDKTEHKSLKKYYIYADIIDILRPSIKRILIKLKFCESKLKLMPCTYINYDKTLFDFNLKENFIVFSSRLEKGKGVFVFLKTASYFFKKYKNLNVKFIIIGKGSLENKIVNFINKHNLNEQVIFEGFYKNPVDLLIKSKIFCSFQIDNPSQSLLEAMACGNVPIIQKNKDYKLFYQKNITYYVKKDNYKRSADLIYKLLTHDKLQNIMEKSRNYVLKEMRIQKYVKNIENIFDSL